MQLMPADTLADYRCLLGLGALQVATWGATTRCGFGAGAAGAVLLTRPVF